jgi:hypothetical protein
MLLHACTPGPVGAEINLSSPAISADAASEDATSLL